MEAKKMTKTDRAVARFCDMMIETINGLEQGWRKTWLTSVASGRPMNANGREYTRMNEFFLEMLSCANGYQMPVFLTFNQCKEMGASVTKGEKSFPVLFWCIYAKNYKTGKTMTIQEYDKLSNAEQDDWFTIPSLRTYDVFNVAQTNLAEVKPELIEKLQKKFVMPKTKTADGMYANEQLDALINGGWVCPIKCERQNRAFYNSNTDSITLPLKEQFNLGGTEADVFRAGEEFYSTALHEMTHSTMTADRCNRAGNSKKFGDEAYGLEELVAELTAAMCGHELGFNTAVEKNNAAYLSSWLKAIKKEPTFLISVLADVNKAASYIDKAMAKVKTA